MSTLVGLMLHFQGAPRSLRFPHMFSINTRVKLLQLIAINHNNSTLLFIQNHISKEASSLLFNPDFLLNTSHIVFLSNVKYFVVIFIDDDIFQ